MLKRLALIAALLLAPGCIGGVTPGLAFTPPPIAIPAAAVGGSVYLITR